MTATQDARFTSLHEQDRILLGAIDKGTVVVGPEYNAEGLRAIVQAAKPSATIHQGAETMDPQACFNRILEAQDEVNRYADSANRDELHWAEDELRWAMVDLWHWLEKGGFPPAVTGLGEHDFISDCCLGLEIRRDDDNPELGFEILRRSLTGSHVVKRYSFRLPGTPAVLPHHHH